MGVSVFMILLISWGAFPGKPEYGVAQRRIIIYAVVVVVCDVYCIHILWL